ncbi:MAG: hypothetical protein M3321_08710 [Actinomycetota bacterium]|nr:hypothetical protein [Actinomycetota bacterium]
MAGIVAAILLGATSAGSTSDTLAAVSGGTPEQEALLRDVLRGIPRSQLRTVAIVNPPEEFEPADATWLEFGVAADDSVENVRGFWQALLVAGIFRDESAKRGLPFVAGKTITVVAQDGTVRDEAASVIDQPLTHEIEAVSDARMHDLVRAGAARAGVLGPEVAFTRPFGRTGVEIVVRTPDAPGFIRSRGQKLVELLGSLVNRETPRAEGAYLEVRDVAGRFVTVSAYSVRTGEGVGYSDPALLEGGTGTASFGTSLD